MSAQPAPLPGRVNTLYARVSTPGQRDTTSLPEQERLCRERAAAEGWPIADADVYREVESGADLYRPALDRLWLAIERRQVARVLIDVSDRLSRDEGDAAAFYRHCDRYGTDVVLVSEEPAATEQARTLRSLAGILARMERSEIARRTQRGKRARVTAGKLLPASVPLYGYAWADATRGRYVPDPETAPIVVRIFEQVAAGVSLHEVCRQLEADGVGTPGRYFQALGLWPAGRAVSDVWRHGTLLRLLRHPAYVGAYASYRWAMQTSKQRDPGTMITHKTRRQAIRASDDPLRVVLGAAVCPPLVDPAVAHAALSRLDGNKAASAGRNPDPLATIWRGQVVCGHCGGRLHTAARGERGGARRYVCLNTHAGPDGQREPCPARGMAWSASGASGLDAMGWADVVRWLRDGATVARLLADWRAQAAEGADSLARRLDALDQDVTTTREKMARLAETIEDTADRESRRTLQARLDVLAGQVAASEGKRAKLLTEATAARDVEAQAAAVSAWAGTVAAEAATFTRAEQVRTLSALGAQMTVWRADHPHADGWPQRYRIVLSFTGYTGAPILVPAHTLAPAS